MSSDDTIFENVEKLLQPMSDTIENSMFRFVFRDYQADSQGINTTLRRIKPGDKISERVYKIIRNLRAGIKSVKHLRLKTDFTVYRGINLSSIDKFISVCYLNDSKLKYLNNYSFLSTSISKDKAESFRDCCLLKISVPYTEDLLYTYLSSHSEYEVLFDFPTYLEIISIEREYNYTLYNCILRKGRIANREGECIVIYSDIEIINDVLYQYRDDIKKSIINNMKEEEDFYDKDLEFIQQKEKIKRILLAKYKGEKI